MKVQLDKIPQYLKEYGHFCNWKYELRDGKKTKVPYTPGTTHKASVSDPSCAHGSIIPSTMQWSRSMPTSLSQTRTPMPSYSVADAAVPKGVKAAGLRRRYKNLLPVAEQLRLR